MTASDVAALAAEFIASAAVAATYGYFAYRAGYRSGYDHGRLDECDETIANLRAEYTKLVAARERYAGDFRYEQVYLN